MMMAVTRKVCLPLDKDEILIEKQQREQQERSLVHVHKSQRRNKKKETLDGLSYS